MGSIALCAIPHVYLVTSNCVYRVSVGPDFGVKKPCEGLVLLFWFHSDIIAFGLQGASVAANSRVNRWLLCLVKLLAYIYHQSLVCRGFWALCWGLWFRLFWVGLPSTPRNLRGRRLYLCLSFLAWMYPLVWEFSWVFNWALFVLCLLYSNAFIYLHVRDRFWAYWQSHSWIINCVQSSSAFFVSKMLDGSPFVFKLLLRMSISWFALGCFWSGDLILFMLSWVRSMLISVWVFFFCLLWLLCAVGSLLLVCCGFWCVDLIWFFWLCIFFSWCIFHNRCILSVFTIRFVLLVFSVLQMFVKVFWFRSLFGYIAAIGVLGVLCVCIFCSVIIHLGVGGRLEL